MTEKKHAYLILAHNEFEVLDLLLEAVDDSRNDIFIHIDKKVQDLPNLKTKYANLYILKNRIDIRWGDVSVVEGEYALFEAAHKNGSYVYYHVLSGVDMPLQSQDAIHSYFNKHQGKEFIGFSKGDLTKHIERKVQRYHLFPKHFKQQGLSLRRIIRYGYMRMQYIFGIKRNQHIEFKKGTQWGSLTHDFVGYLLDKKVEVMNIYHHTFCADEIFVQTICWHSPFRKHIFDSKNEARGCKRMIGWKNNQLLEWEHKDFDMLIQSDALFARKFSSKHIELVERIHKEIILNHELLLGE